MSRPTRLAAVRATLLSIIALSCVNVVPALAKPGHVLAARPEHAENLTVTSILYQSTGLRGDPIQVTGYVVVPDGPTPVSGRPIVAWAHPTTGVAVSCAPSLSGNPLGRVPGLAEMLRRGFIVAATDYPGLGVGGPHPYLVGISEGRAVLDSVRAARELAGRGASDRFVVWGHSQGGQAALFAGKLARGYAPELRLEGVAAAAPASELAALFDADLSTPAGKILTALTLYSWSRVYHVPLAPVLAPMQIQEVNRTAASCLDTIGGLLDLRLDEIQLQTSFLKVNDLTEISPWRGLIARNTPTPPIGDFPVFLAQGTADTIVPFRVTANYAGKLCASGNAVDFLEMPGVSHTSATIVSAPQAVEWMSERFAGRPAPNTCTR